MIMKHKGRGPGRTFPQRLWQALLALGLLLLAACGGRQDLAGQVEQQLGRLQTLQGRLQISLQSATLEQEIWVQPPEFLRTETEAGPPAFQGTIVVLNDREGWVYTPALDMATVVDRTQYRPDLLGEAGAGSMLERLPYQVLAVLQRGYALRELADETIAGRRTRHLEVVIPDDDGAFPPGPLELWLDREFGYPLALRDSSGRQIQFTLAIFNQEIDPLVFDFVPPPGATVHRVQPQP